MPQATLLSRLDLENALDFPSVLKALEEAFHAERKGSWDTPKRIMARTPRGALLAMPCAGGSPEVLGAKLVTHFPGNTGRGLPGVSGLYALFDSDQGEPKAVMDGTYLTLVRTAAVSALATRLLSRPDATTLGVLGAGGQAEFHVRLLATVRPIDSVVIWARASDRAEALLARLKMREDLAPITLWTLASKPEDAARCDVVVTATAATEPILRGRWLKEGAHLNVIGAHTRGTREVDTETITRARILAAENATTLLEAGDFQMAEEEAGGVLSRVVSLASLLDPTLPLPSVTDPRGITVFKSCGVAFEDLAVATLAFGRARDKGLGTSFAFA